MSSQVKRRFSRFDVSALKLSSLPFGLSAAEAGAAGVALVCVVLTIFYYSSSLKPEQDRLSLLQTEYDRQLKVMVDSVSNSSDPNSADSGRRALATLDEFESDYLKPLAKGRVDVINQINALAKKNGLALTSGITMTMDTRVAEPGKEKSSKSKSPTEQLAVFPSLDATFTVFGQYQALRDFIGDLERDKQFLVVDSISLTTIDEGTIGRGSRTATGSGISLSVSLTAYFQPLQSAAK